MATVELTGAERRALRSTGQTLPSTVQVGRDGVTETVVRALDFQLARDGLVKVRLNLPDREARREACTTLAEQTGSALAGSVGRTALYYRPLVDGTTTPS